MENTNTIKIKKISIGENTYQFKYESATRKIEVMIKKMKRAHPWWPFSSKMIEEWEPFQLGDINLYMEIVLFQFAHKNKDMVMEVAGNTDLMNNIEKVKTNKIFELNS